MSASFNFVGYVFYHTHTLIRKSIKYKIIRLVNSYLNREIDRMIGVFMLKIEKKKLNLKHNIL